MELIKNLNAQPGSPMCRRTYALLSSEIRKLTQSADAEITMGYIVSKLLYSLDEATCSREPKHHTMYKGRPFFRCNEKFIAEQLGYSTRQASIVLQKLRDGYGLIEEHPEVNYELFLQCHADRTHCMTITDEGLRYYPELQMEIDTWNRNHPNGFWFGPPKRKKRKRVEQKPATKQEPSQEPKTHEPVPVESYDMGESKENKNHYAPNLD